MPIIAVVGSRRSGKTTAVEAIVKGLTEKGIRVTAVKHISELDFTIDNVGKDTWRYAQAGANIVVSVAAKELAIIRKVDTTKININDIVKNFQDNTDVIILEGFRNITAQDPLMPKIVTAKTTNEALKAAKFFKPIIAFSGPILPAEIIRSKIPHADAIKEPGKLADIVDKRIAPMIKKRGELKEKVEIQIDGKPIPLNQFVQKIVRNVLFSMISTLKGATLKGDEKITIALSSSPKNQ
jgi:molybdopterin-guanine dinucleotide biosynthesis protein MobB